MTPLAKLAAKQPVEQIRVEREQALREYGIAEPLKFLENALVQARIVMIGPTQHHEPDSARCCSRSSSVRRAWRRRLSSNS